MVKLVFNHVNATGNVEDKFITFSCVFPFKFNFYNIKMKFMFSDKLPDGRGVRRKTFDLSSHITLPTFIYVEVISPSTGYNFGIYNLQLLGGDEYDILIESDTIPMTWQGWGRGMKDGAIVGFQWSNYPPEDSDVYDYWTRGDWY